MRKKHLIGFKWTSEVSEQIRKQVVGNLCNLNWSSLNVLISNGEFNIDICTSICKLVILGIFEVSIPKFVFFLDGSCSEGAHEWFFLPKPSPMISRIAKKILVQKKLRNSLLRTHTFELVFYSWDLVKLVFGNRVGFDIRVLNTIFYISIFTYLGRV